MTLQDWAALAEIVAAAGVIISLLYLAAQVRQSNVVARTQARQSWMQLAQGELHKIVDHPPIFDALFSESASREDKLKMYHWLLASLRAREFEWFQYRDGVIDEDHFKAYAGIVGLVLGTERTRRLWPTIRAMYDPGFASFVDGVLASTAPHDVFERVEEALE